jgi:hypothetical protein
MGIVAGGARGFLIDDMESMILLGTESCDCTFLAKDPPKIANRAPVHRIPRDLRRAD